MRVDRLMTLAAALGVLLCNAADPSAAEGDVPKPPAAPAEGGVDLRIRWRPGYRYTYRADTMSRSVMHFPEGSGSPMPRMPKGGEQRAETSSTFSLEPEMPSKEGTVRLRLTFLAYEMEFGMGDRVFLSYDSKSGDAPERGNPFTKIYQRLMGEKFTLVLAPDNTLDRVEGLEEWIEKASEGAPPEAGGMMRQFLGPDFFRQLVAFVRCQPDRPLRPGESWSFAGEVPVPPMERYQGKSTAAFFGMERRESRLCARIDCAGVISSGEEPGRGPRPMMRGMKVQEGKISGRRWFDPELGILVESESDESLKLRMEMRRPDGPEKGETIRREVTQKSTLKLVDVQKTQP